MRFPLVKILEKARGTVELKEDVNKVELPEKIGADKIAKAEEAKETVSEVEKESKDSEGEEA